MTETITDSFCERCGTRYAFEAAAKPRRARLGRVRVLTRGVATFISNDGLPMAEAMAAARSDEERSDLQRQLDAFHKTFNFCMGCRQYTCPSCWNATAGECLTCSPDLTREVLPPAFPDLPLTGPAGTNGDAGEAAAMASLAWPTIDLERSASPEPEAHPVAEAVSPPVAAVESLPAPEPAPLEAPAPEPAPLETPALVSAESFADVPAEVPAEPVAEVAAAAPAEPVAETVSSPDEPASIPAAAAAAAAVAAVVATAASGPEPADDLTDAERAEIVAALAAGDGEAGGQEPAAAAGALAAEPAAAPAPIDPAVTGRDQTRGFLRRFRPAAAAIVATGAADATADEPAPAAAEPPAAEPPAAEPMPEPVEAAAKLAATAALAAAEPEAAEPETETAAAEVAPEPGAAAATQVDTIEQPTWRMVAPDVPAPASPETPDAASPAAWPASTAWPPATPGAAVPPAAPSAAASPWAARLAMSRPETTGIWAASSREVLGATPGPGAPAAAAIQACVSCGLSLSATARFCRRCGSRQG
jgi:hypothetical protein